MMRVGSEGLGGGGGRGFHLCVFYCKCIFVTYLYDVQMSSFINK